MKQIPQDTAKQLESLLTNTISSYKACQNEIEKGLKNITPEKLLVSSTAGKVHFYIKDSSGRKYLSMKEQEKAKALAKQEYYLKMKKLLEKQAPILNLLLHSLTRATPTTVYSRMHPAKQALVKPFFQTDEEYAKAWQEAPYPHGEPPTGRYQTERGETVRSKSEILIANALYTAGIPYRYEEEVDIPGYGSVRPDFTVLNPRTRHQFYWEHFGMMDDFGYREKTTLKIEGYYRAGILPNHLLATFETQERPISITEIKGIIRDYLQ